MNAYEAVMKTADLFERRPELFDFNICHIPECDTPGCALGWIGHFMGVRSFCSISAVARSMGLPHCCAFYAHMNKLSGHDRWVDDAALCAKGLRLYADKYLKPETPDWNAMAQADNAYRPVREEV